MHDSTSRPLTKCAKCAVAITIRTLWWINIDPENNPFLMETSLPTPTTTRVYVKLPEGNYKAGKCEVPSYATSGYDSDRSVFGPTGCWNEMAVYHHPAWQACDGMLQNGSPWLSKIQNLVMWETNSEARLESTFLLVNIWECSHLIPFIPCSIGVPFPIHPDFWAPNPNLSRLILKPWPKRTQRGCTLSTLDDKWIWYWLVLWNMNFIFPHIGNNHPKWLSYFSEGWLNHQPGYDKNPPVISHGHPRYIGIKIRNTPSL